jgi:anti-sigma-K factor RskA
MSDDKHVVDLIPACALDCLDDDEVEVVVAHLVDCPACQAELESYRQVVDELVYAAPEQTPPADLRNRLMDTVQFTPAGTQRLWWQTLVDMFRHPVPAWSFVGALALLVVLGIWLTSTPSAQSPQNTGTMQTVTLVGTKAAPEAQGLIIIGSDGVEGALVVEDLPSLNTDQQYQLWLIDQNGQRTSGVVFSVNSEGYAATMVTSSMPLTSFTAFGITIEPAGGSPGPTGQKVLGGTF